MSAPTYNLVDPKVQLRFYWLEGLLLALAFVTPLAAWLLWRSGSALARSGSLTVFFSAVAEFLILNKANNKHLLNAARLQAGEAPWGFSKPAKVVGRVALVAASIGTVLWGFADILVGP
jgi:uncharacterized membrane protein